MRLVNSLAKHVSRVTCFLRSISTARLYAYMILVFFGLTCLAFLEDYIFGQGGRYSGHDLLFLGLVTAGGLLVCWITSLLLRAVEQISEWRRE